MPKIQSYPEELKREAEAGHGAEHRGLGPVEAGMQRRLVGMVIGGSMLVALSASASASGSAAASAATVSVRDDCEPYVHTCSDFVTYTAAPGEHNHVTVASVAGATPGSLGTVTISDPAVAVTSSDPLCPATAPGTVTCSVDDGDATLLRVTVRAGDGDDTLDFTALSSVVGVLGGGPGDDVLRAGDFADELLPGPGHDVVAGGSGQDTLSFGDLHGPIRVDLASGLVRGAGAGPDQVTGIEDLTGGSGDDVLLGDGGKNTIEGGPGDDRIHGRGGADILSGGTGRDELVGGRGDDEVSPSNGNFGEAELGAGERGEVLRCGPGRDEADPMGLARLVSPDCEYAYVLHGDRVGLHLDHADPTLDRVAIPFTVGPAPYTLTASLTTTGGHLLGRRHGRVANYVSASNRVSNLRLSRTGQRFLRRHRGLVPARLHIRLHYHGFKDAVDTIRLLLRGAR